MRTSKKIAQSKLKKDLKTFNKDWKNLTHKKKLVKNKKYLKKMANDIIKLNNDLLINKDDKVPSLIYHMLTTPIGAPFVSNKTLLNAALNYENQTPKYSDLQYLILNFYKYEHYFNDEIYKIFNAFLEKLNK
jgi:hypothetical protein